MRPKVQPEWHPSLPRENGSHRGSAVQVRVLREGVQSPSRVDDASATAHRRLAVHVRAVREAVLQQFERREAQKETPERGGVCEWEGGADKVSEEDEEGGER